MGFKLKLGVGCEKDVQKLNKTKTIINIFFYLTSVLVEKDKQ